MKKIFISIKGDRMTPSRVLAALDTLLAIRQPVFLWGPPGVGKSQLVAQAAERKGMALRDIRAVLLDPVDLRGLPRIDGDGRTCWCAPAFLPGPQDEAEGVLFLDELNAAPPLVQTACYQLILDRRIGEYRLPDGWRIVAAGNRESDRAVVYRLPTALANRMVHLEVEAHTGDWLAWAENNGIRPEIRAFLRFRPRLLHTAAPQSDEAAFASPRSWAFASRILEAAPEQELAADLLRGTLGEGVSAELLGYLERRHQLPSPEGILAAPYSAPVPDDPADLCAVCDMLVEYVRPEDMEAVAGYAERLPAEYGILLMRDAARRDPRIVEGTPFARWAQHHAEALL